LLHIGLYSQERLNASIQILEDSTGTFSVEDVQELGDRFKHPKDWITHLYGSTFWLKVVFDSKNASEEICFFKPRFIDTVELFIPEQNGTFKRIVSGDDVKLKDQPLASLKTSGIAFKATESKTFYFRCTSRSFISAHFRDFTKLEFIPFETFKKTELKARYAHGVFFGIMAAMFIFNLIIYLIYRDRSYFIYALFVFTQVLYHLSITGFLYEFLFVDIPHIGKYSPYTTAAISLVSFIYFARIYLNAQKHSPKLNRYYIWLGYSIIGVNLIGYFYRIDIANSLMLLQGVAMNVFAVIIAVKAYRKGFSPALYFIIASMLAFIAYFLFVSGKLGITPFDFVARYAFQITVALQTMLFAIGLAVRMRKIVNDLATKELEKERLKKEQEIALKQVLEEQNVLLEEKVLVRTAEIKEAHEKLENQHTALESEKQKSDELLLNILPEETATELKEKGRSEAKLIENVTVLFTDFKGFTKMSERVSPQDLVNDLNICFSHFDTIMEKYGIEKIKTIGDAYMAACGLPSPNENHAKKVIQASFEMRDFIEEGKERKMRDGLPFFEIRIGVHTGPVVAGIVGLKKFQYDIWGDTVNTASRMESSGAVGMVNISNATYERIKDQACFHFDRRGKIEAKGKGAMEMWFVKETPSSYPMAQ